MPFARSVSIATLCLFGKTAVAGTTHCSDAEQVMFSCALEGGDKVVSLCASGEAGARQLAYRYGKTGAVELEFPGEPVSARQAFWHEGGDGDGSFERRLGFTNGGYDYAVRKTASGHALRVGKQAKTLLDKSCNAGGLVGLSAALDEVLAPYPGPWTKHELTKPDDDLLKPELNEPGPKRLITFSVKYDAHYLPPALKRDIEIPGAELHLLFTRPDGNAVRFRFERLSYELRWKPDEDVMFEDDYLKAEGCTETLGGSVFVPCSLPDGEYQLQMIVTDGKGVDHVVSNAVPLAVKRE